MATPTRKFEYSARDQRGKVQSGTIEATSEATVATRLREKGLTPLQVVDASGTGLQREVNIPGFTQKVGLKDIAIMSRQLATMIGAGLSLVRSLSILSEQTENKALQKIIVDVRSQIEGGRSLSVALSRHSDTFPPIMINMVKAGEVGGFLDDVLVSIAANFEGEVALRGKIKSAMTYPVVVFIIAILGTAALLVFVVPVFAKMFADLGGELPFATQVLVSISAGAKFIFPAIIIGGIAFSAWWGRNKNKLAIRSRVEPLYLKLPVFGGLIRKIAISRFTRNLGAMMRSGVPILQALDIVGQSSGNIVIERATQSVQEAVRRGEGLAVRLGNHNVFPPMVVQMIAVGEDTGQLDTMLDKIADFYDQEVESTTEQLTALIEPVMITVLGSIIGGMVIALYLPIFKIFDLIQ